MLRALALRLLGAIGLLRPVYRVYEVVQALRSGSGPDGLVDPPLPPRWLRFRVAGTADPKWFLESGQQSKDSIVQALAAADSEVDEFEAILDFGCGCGRVIRHLSGIRGRLHGTDADAAAIRWCRENLKFATFQRNTMTPALPYGTSRFDFVYALSVFTHLRVDQQHGWMRELVRLVRPGGLVLITTHGEGYVGRLTGPERAAFDRGEVVVRRGQVAGTNLCTSFHPKRYVRETLARGLDVIYEAPMETSAALVQDLFLLRIPDRAPFQ
jgi:SAM-dependent methyltransferase